MSLSRIQTVASDNANGGSFQAAGVQLSLSRQVVAVRQAAVIDCGSQIYDDVANRLRAAHEKVAVGGLFERLRSVSDRPRNQTAFAVVTYTGPARPADRDVARFGQ